MCVHVRVSMQQDTIKWVYNNNESAQEDERKSNQKRSAEENEDGFECKVEGDARCLAVSLFLPLSADSLLYLTFSL